MRDLDVEALVRKLGTRTGELVAGYCAPLKAEMAALRRERDEDRRQLREATELLREVAKAATATSPRH